VKVEFARTGGVAGIRLTATLDTELLPCDEADRLRRVIADAALFDLPTLLKSRTRRPDQFQYRVTVEEGDRIKKVELDESSVPEKLQPLLDYLTDCARARQRMKRS
jgi:hypothetical protein